MTVPTAARRQIKVRVDPELSVQIKRYAAAHNLTETALLQVALREYLTGTSPYETLMRRLDRLGQLLDQNRHAVLTLTEAFASFVRLWLAHTPEVPAQHAGHAWREAQPRWRRFVEHVAKRLHADDAFYAVLAASATRKEDTHG